VVLGISADSVESHAKFKKKYELPYTLLADTEHEVSEA
jgi:peroxiredoxin Q/BCP